MELIYILNVVISAVFVVNFPGYPIRSPPSVICTQIGSSSCSFTLTKMRDYLTLHPTSILSRSIKQIVFVHFFTFLCNQSATCRDSFDNSFSRGLFSFSYACNKYLYCNVYPVSGSITALTRYQGKVSYSICESMLCVAIAIVDFIQFIHSYVNIGNLLGTTLECFLGFLFLVFP